jgi:integrase
VGQRYARAIAEYQAAGGYTAAADDLSIVELSARFMEHAWNYYRPPSDEARQFATVVKHLTALYGATNAASFGPMRFKAVRQRMVDGGWCRNIVNQQCVRLRRIFRWGVENELLPPAVIQALGAVAPLKRGRCDAAESEPVKPVPLAHVEAVAEAAPREIASLIRLQVLTAARAGELVRMRPIDLDCTGSVWLFRPIRHKGTWREEPRTIYIGPRGQSVLEPLLAGCATDGFVFSPRRVLAWHSAKCETHRRPDQKPNPKRTRRVVGDCYTVASYRRCVQRLCEAVGVPVFTPHQLRHTAATEARRQFGIEAAQLLCGHKRADVTQIYAAASEKKALSIARRIG